MAVPIWSGRYIGLPYREKGRDRGGMDCWGLYRLIMAEQFGIALPSYSSNYRSGTDVIRVSELIHNELHRNWYYVPDGHEELGDAIVMRVRGMPAHVGMVIGDMTMIHLEKGLDSCIERYAANRWDGKVHGVFRLDQKRM